MARTNTLEYIYKARDAMTPVIRKIRSQMTGFTSDLAKNNRAIRLMGRAGAKTAGLLKSRFAGFAAAAVGGFGLTKLITVGSNFEDAMLDLSAITGATGKDLDLLKTKTLLLAKASKTYQDQVATGFKLVASAKPELLTNLPALAEMTKAMLLLKNAGGIELSEAVSVGAKALNGFGKDAKFAAEFVDILAAGSKFGASEIKETGEAVKITSALAKEAGLSFLQLNALIQTAAKGSFFGTQAGTAINAILRRMQELGGLDFSKLGIVKPFELVRKHVDSLGSTVEKTVFFKKFFGEEHGKVAAGILANVDALKLLEKQLAITGIAQDQAALKLSSVSAQARGLGVAVSEKIIFAFEQLKPQMKSAIQDMKSWVGSISTDDIDTFATSLRAIAEAITLIGKGLSLIMKVVVPVISVTKGVTEYFSQAFDVLNPFDDATKGFDFPKIARSFVLDNKLLGMFELPQLFPPSVNKMDGINNKTESKTEIKVKIDAPPGFVKSVETQTFGSGALVGVEAG